MPKKEKGKEAVITATYVANTSTRFNHAGQEYALHIGIQYTLPADCPFVQSLIAQKKLVKS